MALQDHYRKNYGRGYAPVGPNFEFCCASVRGKEALDSGHQCTRKNGHGPDGAYCKIHDPAVVAAKRKAQEEKWALEREVYRIQHQMTSNAPAMLDIIRQIAKGHNDPRQLCADFLREKQFEDE